MTTTFPTDVEATAVAEPRHPSRTGGGGVECLCPFCGAFNAGVGHPCRHCRTEDTTAARAAARKRVGPWFVLQSRNPAAPGLSLPALLAMVRQGTVTDRSVIRGPATGQLWRLAGKVRGISREFGQCYGCGGDLTAADPLCPHCQRPQSLPADVDAAAPAATGYVPADRGNRPPPKHDLLTPRDLAKAFSLGYTPAAQPSAGPSGGFAAPAGSVTLDDLLPRPGPSHAKPIKAAVVAAAVSMMALAIGWPLTHVLSAPHLPPTVAVAPAARRVAAALPADEPITTVPLSMRQPTVRPAMLVRRAPAPPVEEATPAGANEPVPTDSPDDDPKLLLSAGLAAEARGDYAAAVQQYDRLESLSSDQWPAGLHDRLKVARAAARGD